MPFDGNMKMLLWIMAAGALAYGAVLGGLFMCQRSLLFRPEANLPTPEQLGLRDIEVVQLRADDGVPLFAWYAKPLRDDGFVVLYLHGNAGHIGHRAERVRRLTALGWGVFLLEYRGYGGNPGKPTEAGWATA